MKLRWLLLCCWLGCGASFSYAYNTDPERLTRIICENDASSLRYFLNQRDPVYLERLLLNRPLNVYGWTALQVAYVALNHYTAQVPAVVDVLIEFGARWSGWPRLLQAQAYQNARLLGHIVKALESRVIEPVAAAAAAVLTEEPQLFLMDD